MPPTRDGCPRAGTYNRSAIPSRAALQVQSRTPSFSGPDAESHFAAPSIVTQANTSVSNPRDDLERKLAGAQGGHHEAPPLVGRVGLVVARAAQRDQQVQIEVGAVL